MRKHVLHFRDFITEKYLGPGEAESYADSHGLKYKQKKDGTHSELTSASSVGKTGQVSSFLIDVADYIKDQFKEHDINSSITLTGGNDAWHHTVKKDYTSRHESGNALDFVLTNPTKKNIRKVRTILSRIKKKYANYDFRFIDEYTSPTAKATASHFHISIKQDPNSNLKFDVESVSGLANKKVASTGAYRAQSEVIQPISMPGINYKNVLTKLAQIAKKKDALMNASDPNQVAAVQKGLLDLGYEIGRVTGIYNSTTRDAVREFQTKNDLKIDGIVGKETFNELAKKIRRYAKRQK